MENQNQSVVETVSADLLNEIFKTSELPPVQEQPKEQVKVEDNIAPLPAVEPTPIVADPPPTPAKITSDYNKKLKSLIEDGIIENFSITLKTDDDQNGQEVFIEDIEDLTEEGYKQIVDGWKNAKKNDIDSKYVSVEGLDDTTKKLIEIRKSGGDISQLIAQNVTAIDQLTELKENIDNEQVQVNIVAHALQQQGLEPEVVQLQIKTLIDKGILEDKANTILDSHFKIHEKAIEDKKQAVLLNAEKEKQDLKDLRKNLSATYKEMNIPDSMQKVLVDNATKLDEDKISNTDKLYFEASKDPKIFGELNLFLNNREAFIKYITSPAVTKAKTEQIKSVFTVNLNKTNKPKLSASSLEEVADEIINQNNK